MKIHPNKQAALAAMKEYRAAVDEVGERLGVYETTEDSCCGVYAEVKFLSTDGKTVCTFCEADAGPSHQPYE